MVRFFLFAAAVSLAGYAPAASADETSAQPAQEQIQNAIDVAFGLSLTSNYVWRGQSNSDDKPALQGYMETSYGFAYAGVWASSVDFGDANTAELDLYAGVRPAFGKLNLDFGYIRYLYSEDGDCCGEFYAKVDYSATDSVSFGGEAFYDPDSDATYLRSQASVALPQEFVVDGGFGAYTDGSATDWDIGVARSFSDMFTVGARYFGRSDDAETTHKFAVTLSIDTSLSALQ